MANRQIGDRIELGGSLIYGTEETEEIDCNQCPLYFESDDDPWYEDCVLENCLGRGKWKIFAEYVGESGNAPWKCNVCWSVWNGHEDEKCKRCQLPRGYKKGMFVSTKSDRQYFFKETETGEMHPIENKFKLGHCDVIHNIPNYILEVPGYRFRQKSDNKLFFDQIPHFNKPVLFTTTEPIEEYKEAEDGSTH